MVVFLYFEAPLALKSHGIFSGKKVTSHPSVDKQLKEAGKVVVLKSYSCFISVIFMNFYGLFLIFFVSFLTLFIVEQEGHAT